MFESMGEILKLNHLNESYWAVLSCGAACYAIWDCKSLLLFIIFLFYFILVTSQSKVILMCWYQTTVHVIKSVPDVGPPTSKPLMKYWDFKCTMSCTADFYRIQVKNWRFWEIISSEFNTVCEVLVSSKNLSLAKLSQVLSFFYLVLGVLFLKYLSSYLQSINSRHPFPVLPLSVQMQRRSKEWSQAW